MRLRYKYDSIPIANSVLPIKQKHGFESKVICLNNTDYYNQRRTAALNSEKIGVGSKCVYNCHYSLPLQVHLIFDFRSHHLICIVSCSCHIHIL